MLLMGIHRYKFHIWKSFRSFCLVFFCFYALTFVSRNRHIHVFLENTCSEVFKVKKELTYDLSKTVEKYLLTSSFLGKVGSTYPAGLLRMNSFRVFFQGFCLFSRNTFFKKYLSSVCC